MHSALPALLIPLLLAACGGTPTTPTNVTVTVSDPDHNDTFHYQATTNFRPMLSPRPDFSQSTAEQIMLEAVNAERSRGGTCPDGRTFAPRAALTFEGHLHEATARYAAVLAGRGTLDLPHRIGESTPARRMVEAGFKPAPPQAQSYASRRALPPGSPPLLKSSRPGKAVSRTARPSIARCPTAARRGLTRQVAPTGY